MLAPHSEQDSFKQYGHINQHLKTACPSQAKLFLILEVLFLWRKMLNAPYQHVRGSEVNRNKYLREGTSGHQLLRAVQLTGKQRGSGVFPSCSWQRSSGLYFLLVRCSTIRNTASAKVYRGLELIHKLFVENKGTGLLFDFKSPKDIEYNVACPQFQTCLH